MPTFNFRLFFRFYLVASPLVAVWALVMLYQKPEEKSVFLVVLGSMLLNIVMAYTGLRSLR
jgi:hypothetical protein